MKILKIILSFIILCSICYIGYIFIESIIIAKNQIYFAGGLLTLILSSVVVFIFRKKL